RLKLAYLFMMTYPGAPTVYYGDEIGMTGGRDPMNRASFPWDQSQWNQDLHDYVRELIMIRHSMPVLRTGSYQPIFTEGQVVAYLRHEFEETVLVVINADDRP